MELQITDQVNLHVILIKHFIRWKIVKYFKINQIKLIQILCELIFDFLEIKCQ